MANVVVSHLVCMSSTMLIAMTMTIVNRYEYMTLSQLNENDIKVIMSGTEKYLGYFFLNPHYSWRIFADNLIVEGDVSKGGGVETTLYTIKRMIKENDVVFVTNAHDRVDLILKVIPL